MRILSIGDIHGRNIWKNINYDDFDQVIFVGDYLDSHDLPDNEIISNLEKLIELQSKQLNLIFLIGNHDLQYLLLDLGFQITGFRESYAELAKKMLGNLKWKFAHQVDGVLYSHGGLLNEYYETIEHFGINYADDLNQYGQNNPEEMLITISRTRGGTSKASSIIWCDFLDLVREKSSLPINQIFGHTAPCGGRMEKRDPYWRLCIDVLTKHPHAFEIRDGGIPKIVNLSI